MESWPNVSRSSSPVWRHITLVLIWSIRDEYVAMYGTLLVIRDVAVSGRHATPRPPVIIVAFVELRCDPRGKVDSPLGLPSSFRRATSRGGGHERKLATLWTNRNDLEEKKRAPHSGSQRGSARGIVEPSGCLRTALRYSRTWAAALTHAAPCPHSDPAVAALRPSSARRHPRGNGESLIRPVFRPTSGYLTSPPALCRAPRRVAPSPRHRASRGAVQFAHTLSRYTPRPPRLPPMFASKALPPAPRFRYNPHRWGGHPAPKRGRAVQVTPVSPAGPAPLSLASPAVGPPDKSLFVSWTRVALS